MKLAFDKSQHQTWFTNCRFTWNRSIRFIRGYVIPGTYHGDSSFVNYVLQVFWEKQEKFSVCGQFQPFYSQYFSGVTLKMWFRGIFFDNGKNVYFRKAIEEHPISPSNTSLNGCIFPCVAAVGLCGVPWRDMSSQINFLRSVCLISCLFVCCTRDPFVIFIYFI